MYKHDKLPALCKKIKGISSFTEDDFLQIGARLQDFHQRAKEMTNISSSAANIISGDEILRTINELKSVLESGTSYLEQLDIEYSQIDNMLKYIAKILGRASTTVHTFDKIVKNFRIFSINIRILSSGLSSNKDGFIHLGNDIKKQAQIIEDRAKGIISQSELITGTIEKSLKKAGRHRIRQSELARIILENTSSTLSSLSKKHAVSTNVAKQISDMSHSIFNNIGNIIVSLQFHDISRQQLEHVAESLSDLYHRLDDNGPVNSEDLDESSKGADSAVHISNLQIAQLTHTRDEIVSAVEGIINNLDIIVLNINEMANQTGLMTGVKNNNNSSFLTEMDLAINNVTKSLQESISECTEIGQELFSTVTTVVRSVEDMGSFIKEIENIGAEIELLSLNARIKSAHTQEEGVGLSVIAEAIQGLSEDMCNKTSEVSKTLRSMAAAVQDDLSFGIDTVVSQRNKDSKDMVNNLNILGDSLHNINSQVSILMNDLDKIETKLARDIENSSAGITVHKRVHSILEEVITDLNEITGEFGTGGEHNYEAYKKLESRYTMHSERNVHHQHFKSLISSDKIEKMGFLAVKNDMPGNLELFR